MFGVFVVFYLALIRTFEVTKNPDIFLIGAYHHNQEINYQFDGTINHFGHMAFNYNKEKKWT